MLGADDRLLFGLKQVAIRSHPPYGSLPTLEEVGVGCREELKEVLTLGRGLAGSRGECWSNFGARLNETLPDDETRLKKQIIEDQFCDSHYCKLAQFVASFQSNT